MRISVVHSYYASSTPSGENVAVDMQVAALERAGHEVQLVSIHTDELSRKRTYPIKAAVTVATGRGESPIPQLREFRPDVVHVHNLFPNFGTKWLDIWQGPLVATIHNFRPLCARGVLFRDGHDCTLCPDFGSHHAVIHKCYKNSRLATAPLAYRNRHGLGSDPLVERADRLIVLSERARAAYLRYGATRDKLSVVPNFIDETPPYMGTTDKNAPWLYAGRLTQEKGILDLLNRWPAGEHLQIAGNGPEAVSVKSIALQKKNVTFLGALDRKRLLELLPSTKGLVLPSLWAEGLPTTYLEALAAGRPVISRHGNSAADDIKRWAEELVFDSTEGLENALNTANNCHAEIAKKARLHYQEHFTESVWIHNIESIYEASR